MLVYDVRRTTLNSWISRTASSAVYQLHPSENTDVLLNMLELLITTQKAWKHHKLQKLMKILYVQQLSGFVLRTAKYSQNVADNSYTPHVCFISNRFIVYNFWSHKLRCPKENFQRACIFCEEWKRKPLTAAWRFLKTVFL